MTPVAPHLAASPEGLFLPAFAAHLDPPAAVPRAVLSHAHADHAAAGHGEIWATRETLAIYRRRHPEWEGASRELGYGERVEAAGSRLELLPSGHVLGAAQVRVEGEEGSMLYTGDFRL